MNLNEECLLQFLQRDIPVTPPNPSIPTTEISLTSELRRILRRNRYVSFPPAILVRRGPQ
jgi:hypothetical protein